jgi:uncharacterized protein (UPF0254 family)
MINFEAYIYVYKYVYTHTYIHIYIYIPDLAKHEDAEKGWMLEGVAVGTGVGVRVAVGTGVGVRVAVDDDDNDVYLIKLQRDVLKNLISTRGMQISQTSGINK